MKTILLVVLTFCTGIMISAAETITKITGNAADWGNLKNYQLLCWISNEKPEIPTSVKFGYDDSKLYVRVVCSEPNMIEARQAVRYPRHDAPVWGNECIELFLQTDLSSAGYYQFVIDIHNQAADIRFNDPKFPRPWEWDIYWTRHVEYRPDGYTVNIAIPWKNIGVTPGNARSIKLNLSRMRYISPAGRFVLSPKTTRHLHNTDNYLFFSGINIAAPDLTAKVINSAPQEGRNTMQLILNSAAKNSLEGEVSIFVTDAKGVENLRKSVPVKIPAKGSAVKKIDWIQDRPGLFPVRVTFADTGKKGYDIYAATLRFNRPLELNETQPWGSCGKDYSMYCRVFTPGNSHKLEIRITDNNNKVVANDTTLLKSKAQFIVLPCRKLPPGRYNVSLTLDDSFTEKISLRITPDPIN